MALVNEFNERLLKIINELAEDEARFNKSYIPVEWIKQWDIKCQDGKLNHWLYDNYEWHEAIMAMLEDWGERK